MWHKGLTDENLTLPSTSIGCMSRKALSVFLSSFMDFDFCLTEQMKEKYNKITSEKLSCIPLGPVSIKVEMGDMFSRSIFLMVISDG